MLNNYLIYLKFLDEKFAKFFDKQKPYIFCKKGCAKCCKNAQFPYSEIEIFYLMKGAKLLSHEIQENIKQNVENIREQKSKFDGERFLYNCPFLIDDVCSVYNYRGIVCRSFGLMYKVADGKNKVPFCCFQGLNYSNVVEEGTSIVSGEKFENLGLEEEPLAFNISYEFLTDSDFEKGFNFKFGDKKPMIEWFL